tara:strand:+ start:498 stop:998 length:501 start_codon:yes stop_codon:yes gene_type:complete
MRQFRAVIRSLVTQYGTLVALDDASIIWKQKGEREKRLKITAQASVILGLIGPNGRINRVVIGDDYGGISFVSIPKMELIERFVVGDSRIRSLCCSSISGESILVGCEDGKVHMVGQNVPNNVVTLFELEGPASALRVEGTVLHIHQGWERKVVDWMGENTLLATV